MKSYLGYSADAQVRYSATSGGVGSAFLKWLFDKDIIQSAISFKFNNQTLRYSPLIIHSYDDYEISGSIYQEIDLIDFIKKHINEIKGDFACFCLPCQSRGIRNIVEKKNHKVT